jgi:hypothetical protein
VICLTIALAGGEVSLGADPLWLVHRRAKVELDWVKKKLGWAPDAKRELIEPDHPQLSIARQ